MQDNFSTGISNAAIGSNLAVMINSAVADGIKLPTAATVECFGVTQHATTASGQTQSVQISGITKVTAAGTIARGDKVKVDTDGKIVTTTTSTDLCIGIALLGGAAGDLVTILLKRIVVL